MRDSNHAGHRHGEQSRDWSSRVGVTGLAFFTLPYQSWFAYQLRATAGMVQNAWQVWRHRS